MPGSPARAPLPSTPDDVGARVDAAFVERLLGADRPEGEAALLEVSGVAFPVVTAGSAERCFLFVHGLGHDMWDFAPLFARRPADARFRALDLPGFGLSAKPSRAFDMQILVDAVLVAARGLPAPPLVVGSSLGGHVAMLAALSAPAAFAGLFLTAPGGLERVPRSLQAFARAHYSFSALCARPDAVVVKTSRRIFAHQSPASEALAARKLAVHRSPLRSHFARPFADVVSDVFRHPVAERCADLRPPVHLLFGEQDVIVPASSGRRAAERYGFGLTRLEGVGHLPMVEAPEVFAAELMAFAGRVWGGE